MSSAVLTAGVLFRNGTSRIVRADLTGVLSKARRALVMLPAKLSNVRCEHVYQNGGATVRFYLGETRTDGKDYGSCTVPWWTIGCLIDRRHQSVRIGPVHITRYRFGRSDYSVHRGDITAGWHWFFEWFGFKPRTTSWMGGCFG